MKKQETVLNQLQSDQMTNTLTSSKEMILTDHEKELVISNYIASEKKKRDSVFGKVVRNTDPTLIEFDKDELLNSANEKKHYEIEMENYRQQDLQRLMNERGELHAYWTYEKIYDVMMYESHKLGVKFEYCEENKIAVQALCFFLSWNERFETELGFDFKKGIMLRGKYGTGKTHMIRCVKDNGLRPIQMQSMIIIKEKVENEGYCHYGPGYGIAYLDDVGAEDLPIMHYGNKHNWFKDFIEKEYYKGKDFNKIIFSTNLTIKELAEKYGERVTDRIAEMFNIIDIKGTSRRIKAIKEKKNKKDGTA